MDLKVIHEEALTVAQKLKEKGSCYFMQAHSLHVLGEFMGWANRFWAGPRSIMFNIWVGIGISVESLKVSLYKDNLAM